MAATAASTSLRKKVFACRLYFVQTLVLGSRVTADEQAAADLRGALSEGAASAPAANRTVAISAFIFDVTLMTMYRAGACVMEGRTKP